MSATDKNVFKVIVSDLDGTLLDGKGKVDPLTAGTLREIEALGVHIVLATSRHHLDASRVREALGVRAHLVTANGARVHGPDGERILAEDIEPEVARALMGPEIAGDRLVAAIVDAAFLVNKAHPRIEAHFAALGLVAHVQDLATHGGEGVAKVTYMGRPEDLAQLRSRIEERFGARVAVTFAEGYLEVMGATVSKGKALIDILARLGAPASAVVAFGDGENDLDMLAMAGRAFVMSGSAPALLAALPQAATAGSNDEAGVARVLRGVFGLSD